MPQYLAIAESVYRKVKEVELFSDDTIENLNNLMIFIRKEITGSVFKWLCCTKLFLKASSVI